MHLFSRCLRWSAHCFPDLHMKSVRLENHHPTYSNLGHANFLVQISHILLNHRLSCQTIGTTKVKTWNLSWKHVAWHASGDTPLTHHYCQDMLCKSLKWLQTMTWDPMIHALAHSFSCNFIHLRLGCSISSSPHDF